MGSTVEFREFDDDRLKDFSFGCDKRRKLILMFPMDGAHPPPEEEPSESDMMKARKKHKKHNPYDEENLVQDWTQQMLIKDKGVCVRVMSKC